LSAEGWSEVAPLCDFYTPKMVTWCSMHR